MGQFEWLKKKKSVKLKTNKEQNRQKCYNSLLWRNTSSIYKHENPLCEVCFQEGIITPAEHVHHAQKFNDQTSSVLQYQLLTDPDNLISVCSNCHHKIHQNRADLSEKQLLFLQKTKENVFKKYLLRNTPIILTDDLNTQKYEDK